MRFLKNLESKFGELLDDADKKTNEADFQTIATAARDAAGGALKAGDAIKARAGKLDLGLVEGWNELTTQVTGDLKGAAAAAAGQEPQPSVSPLRESGVVPADSVASTRLADLRERVRELEAREAERKEARERLEARLEEVDEEVRRLQEDQRKEEAEAAEMLESTERSGPERPEPADAEASACDKQLEAMRSEFFERQAAADARVAALQAELHDAEVGCEPVNVELEFWREKAQRMLDARGLEDVPEDVRVAAEKEVDGVEESGSAEAEAAEAARVRREADLEEARREHAKAVQAHASRKGLHEGLETRLAEVMRDSDALMERVDAQRRREKELEASFAVADAMGAAESAAAQAAVKRAATALAEKAISERRCADELRHAREARLAKAAAGLPSAERGEASNLRREVDALRVEAESLAKDNANLEGRLKKYRAAAAADLERAVPLSSARSCWSSIDGPTMKFVIILVRSTCLRRFFAIHLIGMYVWLFFLIFWLEEH
eukprot:gnl/TRDRNA2_/TRDRNA2_42921_c0_seq1.p1 gnl/TRDRNA2_/TRDRNA2_42921_c0~~gnl/TRDRNA2_/TRDRNA2_42921_c0_seq1.p1  ORF type:complete len:498 (+),score=158.16 gnl/TRDRNA2_/TRDRNA2_42921_c0_seq1:88-1581(+)